MVAVAEATLRSARPADEPALRDLYRATRASEFEAAGWPAAVIATICNQQYEWQQAHYRHTFPNLEHRVVVATNGSVIGQSAVDRGPDSHRLVDIAVAPHSRGRGLGTRLLAGIIEDADAAGLPLVLTVGIGSPARRLYERHGFVVESSTELLHYMCRLATGKGAQR
jgi:GNAT superfamily N-acetyltransferase